LLWDDKGLKPLNERSHCGEAETLSTLADSNRDLRDLHRRFFTYHGYQVETAADGLSCLEKLRHLRPDVLVLDRELPWGGGCGVLVRMREELS